MTFINILQVHDHTKKQMIWKKREKRERFYYKEKKIDMNMIDIFKRIQFE